MDNMKDLQEAVGRIEKMLEPQEDQDNEFAVAHVKRELDRAVVAYPSDMVMRRVATLVTNMFNRDRWQTIKSADLSEYFNSFDNTSSGSQYRSVMAAFLPGGDIKKQAGEGDTKPPAFRHEYNDEFRGDLSDLQKKRQESPAPVEAKEGLLRSIEVPNALKEFTENLDDRLLATSTPFKSTTVELAQATVRGQLSSFGYNSAQINLHAFDSNSLFYKATIDTNRGKFAISVPVEIAVKDGDELINLPSSFYAGDEKTDFTQENLNKSIEEASQGDITKFTLDPKDIAVDESALRNELYRSTLDRNDERSNQILSALQEKISTDEFVNVLHGYKNLLKKVSTGDIAYKAAPASRTVPSVVPHDPRGQLKDKKDLDKDELEKQPIISNTVIFS